MTAEIPDDREIFDGDIATYWFDNGILVSRSKSVKRDVGNISANAALVSQISGGKKVPLMVYLTRSSVPDRATRELSKKILPQNYTAMAMVADSGLTGMIMNILFRLNKPPIPIRSFTDPAEAHRWLTGYL